VPKVVAASRGGAYDGATWATGLENGRHVPGRRRHHGCCGEPGSPKASGRQARPGTLSGADESHGTLASSEPARSQALRQRSGSNRGLRVAQDPHAGQGDRGSSHEVLTDEGRSRTAVNGQGRPIGAVGQSQTRAARLASPVPSADLRRRTLPPAGSRCGASARSGRARPAAAPIDEQNHRVPEQSCPLDRGGCC
jgi:hypothetical protein